VLETRVAPVRFAHVVLWHENRIRLKTEDQPMNDVGRCFRRLDSAYDSVWRDMTAANHATHAAHTHELGAHAVALPVTCRAAERCLLLY
jgi:hypothetical protein